MEKKSIFNGKKLEPVCNKEKLGEKIDNLWGKPSTVKRTKPETKKLVIKLETGGTENRKLLLKLESGTSKLHGGNFGLISELLGEFFKDSDK